MKTNNLKSGLSLLDAGYESDSSRGWFAATPSPVGELPQAVRRKLAAYERHIQLGLIAQGLLQFLALHFRRVVWFNFHTYIRTASPQKPPSEWVVSHALRHTWLEFLAGSPESLTLKKFLASKISLARCGYADILSTAAWLRLRSRKLIRRRLPDLACLASWRCRENAGVQ